MTAAFSGLWLAIGIVCHGAGAAAALVAAGWLAKRRERFGPAGTAIVTALLLTALWSVAAALGEDRGFVSDIAEAVRNLAWLVVLVRLFASDGRHASVSPVRPVAVVLASLEVLQIVLDVLMLRASGADAAAVFHVTLLFRLLVAVGALVLVHNLYLGGSAASRAALRWPALALAGLWGFDLNFYTIAYLADGWPSELAALRGLVAVAAGLLLATGASGQREALRLRPSRAVAFQSVSLMLIGAYLLAMFAIAQWLAHAGGDFARVMELGFLALAGTLALVTLASPRLRGWSKVMVTKHLFQHRYDYRGEWLRFNRTIGELGGEGGGESATLEERVIKAVADIADSPAGLLLVPDETGDLTLAARWQWPAAEVPANAMSAAQARFFEGGAFIVDLDGVRAGRAAHGEDAVVADWLCAEERAWALVPLLHFERLTGVVVLAAPPWQRKLDWEDFDLLRVVGQQLASYLAEQAGQHALEEASRFDDFNRRIAFVMHDIKNLASQLGLLARNAELHADKPAFRDDMLLTLRNSADKLNALLARLSRYGGGQVQQLAALDGAAVARAVVERFRGVHSVVLAEAQPCAIVANAETLEQVLVHLIQNAADASEGSAPVFLSVTCDGILGRFDVVDSGSGMSPEFVRSKLFRPFVSSKPGGFGIGAFEARELVRAMRGRLEVESREGLGSRFTVRLPLADARTLAGPLDNPRQDVA